MSIRMKLCDEIIFANLMPFEHINIPLQVDANICQLCLLFEWLGAYPTTPNMWASLPMSNIYT